MKIKDIIAEAKSNGDTVWNRTAHYLSDLSTAIKNGASKSNSVEKGTKFNPAYYEKPIKDKKLGKVAPADSTKQDKDLPVEKPTITKATAPSTQQKTAPATAKTVGRIPVPKGHILKMVMPSAKGSVDYFRYPNGKWYVQWTSGSALQAVSSPETVENLNYLLPSQASSIKVVPVQTPTTNKRKGGRK